MRLCVLLVWKVSNNDDKKYLKEIIKKDNQALSLIGSAVEEYIFTRINVAKSSKKAYDILKSTYEGEVVVKLKTLRRNVENANMQRN
jgi:hypothetical protein